MEESRKRFHFFKGRLALYAILKALDLGPGDEVIIPGFTCVVVPNALIYLGIRPVYADIDPATFNISAPEVRSRITPRTRAIIAQHTFGIPAEMDPILALAKGHGLFVIEDSCHALGSEYGGRRTGTMGDAAFFSSQWSKPVTSGLGGWAVVKDGALRKKLARIHAQMPAPSAREDLLLRLQYVFYSGLFRPSLFWFLRDLYRGLSSHGLAIGSSSKNELDCEKTGGYEKKMSQWQSTLLERKLSGIESYIAKRKEKRAFYENALMEKGMETLKLPPHYAAVLLRYPVFVEDKEKTLKEARKSRIELGDWFLSPLHPNLANWEKACYEKGSCPKAEKLCRHIVNLPMHSGINKKEVNRVADFIRPYTVSAKNLF